MHARENAVKMARKTFAIVLIVVLVISMSMAFVLPSSFLSSRTNSSSSNSDQYAGYSQVQVYENTGYVSQFGSFSYVFVYYSATTNNGTVAQGYVAVFIQGASRAPTDFPLTTNVSHDYYGITFAITYVGSNYIILMAKST